MRLLSLRSRIAISATVLRSSWWAGARVRTITAPLHPSPVPCTSTLAVTLWIRPSSAPSFGFRACFQRGPRSTLRITPLYSLGRNQRIRIGSRFCGSRVFGCAESRSFASWVTRLHAICRCSPRIQRRHALGSTSRRAFVWMMPRRSPSLKTQSRWVPTKCMQWRLVLKSQQPSTCHRSRFGR